MERLEDLTIGGGSGSGSGAGSGSGVFEEEEERDPQFGGRMTRPPRHNSSKYDFVKVRVWLVGKSDHYYVLSRFLVSRMLTVTKIPNHVAIKISLELKKLLIDNSLLDVSQTDLEANLFKLMERRGYGAEYISRYKMMTRFHHQRVPLIILVCGTACVGKSTIATQLAQRLNLPNVLQTDMVYELLRTATDAPLASTPIWDRDFASPEELITEFCRECRIVRKGLDGDLKKAMKDGKPVIIEGIHLDPAIYLTDEKTGGLAVSGQKKVALPSVAVEAGAKSVVKGGISKVVAEERGEQVVLPMAMTGSTAEEQNDPAVGAEAGQQAEGSSGQESGLSGLLVGACLDHAEMFEAVIGGCGCFTCVGRTKELELELVSGRRAESQGRKSKSHLQVETPPRRDDMKVLSKSIVVPIVLKMADVDHQTLLEERIACKWSSDNSPPAEGEKEASTIQKLRIIQDYVSSFEAQGMCVVNMSATTFPQTIDWLHGYLLECIERGCATPSPVAGPRAGS